MAAAPAVPSGLSITLKHICASCITNSTISQLAHTDHDVHSVHGYCWRTNFTNIQHSCWCGTNRRFWWGSAHVSAERHINGTDSSVHCWAMTSLPGQTLSITLRLDQPFLLRFVCKLLHETRRPNVAEDNWRPHNCRPSQLTTKLQVFSILLFISLKLEKWAVWLIYLVPGFLQKQKRPQQ